MGFTQENRFNAPQPEIHDTDYGARYVKAGTETPAGVATSVKEEEKPAVDVVPSGTIVFDDADGSQEVNDGDTGTSELQEEVAVPHQQTEQVDDSNDTAIEDKQSRKPRKKAGRPRKQANK